MTFGKGKLAVFFGSFLVVLYGVSAAFYGRVVARDDAYKEIAVFMDALKKVTEDYVEVPDMSKVQEGAFRGLVEALDPYSTYLTKAQVQSLEERKAASNGGVGMVLSKRTEVLYVVATNRDGPADLGGVRPGDYLIAIDGVGVEDKSTVEVESLLRGEVSSKVKLTLFRGARTKPVEVELTRKADTTVPVATQVLEGEIGLLDVSSLSGQAPEQARVKLKALISSGVRRLVLDLRDCADGQVADGAELANYFLPQGVIYSARNRQGETVQEVRAREEKFVSDLPLVVLINGSTSGPAEIVAGALKDNKRATVVGERSFGSGSSQTRIALKSGALLILSTSKYYTPSGKKIQDDDSVRNMGIKPDVQAPDDERHQDMLVESYYDEREDTAKFRELRARIGKEQLDRAIEIVQKTPSAKKAA